MEPPRRPEGRALLGSRLLVGDGDARAGRREGETVRWQRTGIGDQLVDAVERDDAVVGVLADQRVIGHDVDGARGVDEAPRRERHALVARRGAEAGRDAVDGEEGLVDPQRLEQRAEAGADQAARLGVEFAAGQDDLEAGASGEPLEHVERVGDDGDVVGGAELLGEEQRHLAVVDRGWCRRARPPPPRRGR